MIYQLRQRYNTTSNIVGRPSDLINYI